MFLLFILSFAFSFAQEKIHVDDYWCNITTDGRISFAKGSASPYTFVFKSLDEVLGNNITSSTPLNGSWIFSNPTYSNTTGINFNMTRLINRTHLVNDYLTFAFTIRNSTTNSSCPNGVFCLKFDVILSNYLWNSGIESTKLNLVFNLFAPNDNTTHLNSLTAQVQESYLSIASNASVKNETGNVSGLNVSLNANTTIISVIYPHFSNNSTLTHDPIILGMVVSPTAPYVVGESVYVGLAISAVVIAVIVIAGTVYMYIKKRSGYDFLG